MTDLVGDAVEELIDNNQNEAIAMKPIPSTSNGNDGVEPTTGVHEENDEEESACGAVENVKPMAHLFQTSYALVLAFYKIIEDVLTAKRYNKTHQTDYFFITMGCLIIPSFMYSIYIIGKFCKNNIENEKQTDIYTVVILFLKNTLLFIPMKLSSFCKKIGFLMRFYKTSCCKRFDEDSSETVKTFRGEINTISFFQRFYAGFPQIVLQLYILLVTDSSDVDYNTVYMQFLVSGLSIYSLCSSVDRVDDGPLSIILSRIGWLSFIFSRCLVIALLTTIIGRWIVLACLIHVISITLLIYSVAEKSRLKYPRENPIAKKPEEKLMACNFFTILTAFGFQSLIYWPLMFNLNMKYRQANYFGLVVAENTAVLIAYVLTTTDLLSDTGTALSSIDKTVLIAICLIVGFTLIGLVFLFLYLLWKPQLTEHWKLHLDSLEGKDAKNSGIYGVYYEFFNVAFTLPITTAPDEL